MTMLYAGDPEETGDWTRALKAIDPSLDIRVWPEWGRTEDIDFIIVAGTTVADFRPFRNLKAIQSTWAGVNNLLRSSGLPEGVPIARMVDRGLGGSMAEYVVFHVLDELRDGPQLRQAQHARQWRESAPRNAADICVGILGFGTLGQEAGEKLRRLGFPVKGWSRSPKSAPGIECFSGPGELGVFLGQIDILVCLLPLTQETEGFLNAALFAQLKPGAVLINAARGAHLNESDLLEALALGHVRRAVLDVLRTEPLPAEHPFWRHPAIIVTPHVAAITRAGTGARDIIENYRRALSGQPLLNAVDRRRGY